MAAEYKRTRQLRFAALEERETPEARFWRRFKPAVVVKQLALPSHVAFSAAQPHDYCVTSGARIALFDARTNKERRTLSRFKDAVFSGTYRADGRLVACGGARGDVQVIDAKTKGALRGFTGHSAAVHTVRFAPDGVHLLSAADDRSVRFWDLPTAAAVAVLEGAHDDYVRCSAVSGGGLEGGGPGTWATGSYDHTVRVWDPRALAGGSSSSRSSSSSSSGSSSSHAAELLDDGDDGDVVDAAAAAEDEEGDGDGGADGRRAGDEAMDEDIGAGEDAVADEDADDVVGGGGIGGRGARGAGALSATSSAGRAAASGRLPRRRLRAGCVMSVDHGEPVTQVMLLPGGSTMLTAGGCTLKLWDLIGGGRLVHAFTAHQKLVTCLALDGTSTRLLSAGLDGLVKVYELGAFGVTHSMRYAAPVLSLAVAPDNSRLIVGCTDGSLHVKQRAINMGDSLLERKEAAVLRSGSYRYFLRGRGAEAVAGEDEVVAHDRKPRLRPYDKLLKAFEYGAALRVALQTKSASVSASMLQELRQRHALGQALSSMCGDDDAAVAAAAAAASSSSSSAKATSGLELFLGFLIKYISHPRYTALLIDAAHVALDLFAPRLGQPPAHGQSVELLFGRLQARLREEIAVDKELLKTQGVLDLLMAASTGS